MTGRRRATGWPEAREAARRAAGQPLPGVRRGLAEALDHVLAEPLRALTHLPPFDTSAMDGWAVSGPGPWHELPVGVTAGMRPEPLAAGTAVRIATGAWVPTHTIAVLRREDGEVGPDGLLRVRAAWELTPGRDIRRQGQECAPGDELLPDRAPVTVAVLGLAAAAGHDQLFVHRRPAVEVLLLGDELLHTGVPRDGRIRDALGPMVGPWLRSEGAEVAGLREVPDDLRLLRAALEESEADVVVTTGSTASGPRDFLHDALRDVGARLVVDSAAVRPGHPMILAELPARHERRRHLVGLPGNPLAAAVGLMTLAAPLVRRLAGHADRAQLRLSTSAPMGGHAHDTRLWPAARTPDGVLPLPHHGSAMLRGLALADVLAVVPPGGAEPGDLVEVLDLPHAAR